MSFDKALARLAPQIVEFEPGHVWLAGAGPGNAGQLTLDVVSALAQADAVIYDALVDASILRAADGADLHFVGKRGGKASARQDDITALLIALAGRGKRVLRLKGGDPYVFGRGGEEALALAAAGIPFRILPGVTSAFGALASAGIPATMRGFNKAIILATGHAAGTPDDLDWAALAKTGQPIVVYMGLANLAKIAAALVRGGLAPATPAAIITAATTPEERVLVSTLGRITQEAANTGITSPGLIVIGEIVSMRAQLGQLANLVKSA
ncbi:uroporphyrinogen-III C-methyltransferase [Nitratireductor mangrovi]|uniref:uroporphyrinogen-III C-methyltransferase n=1 Tax=Nitratireductor mangrovi TaxID=2599600 RepID=A0A5B8L1B3_9HYPH|nr:uroporphyrinogen-III C-methyltransferase [Nitratireductor mangrovi]QDZ01613.1 uroporphyrinogen-III C-methyltransferase [Nitratireductor mangrovi]